MHTFSFILFASGQCRVMGKITYDDACCFIQNIHYIYSDISNVLHLVSQTVVFKLEDNLCPVNLYHLISEYNNDVNVRFEGEIFPAISLHYWNPVHVNLFASGKVVILGKNALVLKETIHDWICMAILLLSPFD